ASARSSSVTCVYASDMQHVDIRRREEFASRGVFFQGASGSLSSHVLSFCIPQARVAQWIRAFASAAKGRRFDPCRGYQSLPRLKKEVNHAGTSCDRSDTLTQDYSAR